VLGGGGLKIKDGFLLKKIAGDYMVVPVGDNLVDVGAMIVLNETGVFLWEQMKDDKSEEQLTEAIVGEYGVDRACAAEDVREFVGELKQNCLVV
jgi:hypothetical protein